MLRSLVSRLVPEEQRRALESVPLNDAGYGYDALGFCPGWLPLGMAAFLPAYKRYFRVRSRGATNIPRQGRAIIAANHSGMLPLDAVMLYIDVVEHTEPKRIPRTVVDHFVPLLPAVGTFFARTGCVDGSRTTMRYLLEHEQLVSVFPEGVPGVSKGYAKRYQLQEWRVGHVELAIRYQAPIVPVGIVGAEEAFIQIAKFEVGFFGSPHLPIPLSLVPLPARFYIHYGEPIDVAARHPPEHADDPEVLHAVAAEVKASVEQLIQRGLDQRPGVFR